MTYGTVRCKILERTENEQSVQLQPRKLFWAYSPANDSCSRYKSLFKGWYRFGHCNRFRDSSSKYLIYLLFGMRVPVSLVKLLIRRKTRKRAVGRGTEIPAGSGFHIGHIKAYSRANIARNPHTVVGGAGVSRFPYIHA